MAIDRSASRHLPPEIDDPVFAHLEGGDIDREPLAQVARPHEHIEVGRVVDETAQRHVERRRVAMLAPRPAAHAGPLKKLLAGDVGEVHPVLQGTQVTEAGDDRVGEGTERTVGIQPDPRQALALGAQLVQHASLVDGIAVVDEVFVERVHDEPESPAVEAGRFGRLTPRGRGEDGQQGDPGERGAHQGSWTHAPQHGPLLGRGARAHSVSPIVTNPVAVNSANAVRRAGLSSSARVAW